MLAPRECYLQWINFYRRLRSIFRGIILMFVNIGRKFIYLVEIFFLTKWNIIYESLSFDIIFFPIYDSQRKVERLCTLLNFKKESDIHKSEDHLLLFDMNIGKYNLLLICIFFHRRGVVIVNESKTKWIYVVKTVSN